jgi:hypothetical protein
VIPQSDEREKDIKKEQEALEELKDNDFTIVKDYLSK